MSKDNLIEVILGFLVIALLLLLINPSEVIWMPDMFAMLLVAALLIISSLYLGFLWRERVVDEREALHRLHAGRNAYLVGIAVLVIGVAYQSYSHELDPWLAVTLGTMLLGKIVAIWYAKNNL
jgi:hypothetical protein